MKAWFAYVIVALVWGSTYFAIALGIESFQTFGMVAARYLAGGLLALLLSRLSGEAWPLRWRPPAPDAPGLPAPDRLQRPDHLGRGFREQRRHGRPVLHHAALLRPPGPRAAGAAAPGWGSGLGLSGVAILILSRSGAQTLRLPGLAAILAAVILWAYGTLHGRRYVKGQGLLGQVGVQMLTGGTLALLLVPFTGGFLHAPLTWKAGLAVAYLAVFGSLVAYSAFVYLSKAWLPTRMSTYVYINPVVAVLLGSLFLGEPFSAPMVLGMVIILLGVGLLQTAKPLPDKVCTCGTE